MTENETTTSETETGPRGAVTHGCEPGPQGVGPCNPGDQGQAAVILDLDLGQQGEVGTDRGWDGGPSALPGETTITKLAGGGWQITMPRQPVSPEDARLCDLTRKNVRAYLLYRIFT